MASDKAYRKAEQKIEEALKLGSTELDLSFLGLTELPESLAQLWKLMWLNLSANQLTLLPESLRNLQRLLSLNLANNQLTMVLPEWLTELTHLQELNLDRNNLAMLPTWFSKLGHLRSLDLSNNRLRILPEWFGSLTGLQSLELRHNQLEMLPDSFVDLSQLQTLDISFNNFTTLPSWLERLTQLKALFADCNQLTDLPASLAKLRNLSHLTLLSEDSLQALRQKSYKFSDNPLNLELLAAYREGLEAVKTYLRAKAESQVVLNEAKLIIIGEGEVGKSCLLGALRGDNWEEGRPTTHGIEIKSIKLLDPDSKIEITLNGWDFGGQRVYRPTHQLFFSAPAVYLVVWKPREGPQQGFVKEWIQLVKRREPDAKILVVATHGGPQQRQPDIDHQELWDLFGKNTVIDFFHVESKPDEKGQRRGIEELKYAIARITLGLPEVGRSIPKHWQEVRETLARTESAYMPLERVLELCHLRQMDDDEARLFVTIEHRLGHLIHYQHDPALRDIVVLKPDWLATAISFILDDESTRNAHGLVRFSRLSHLWDDPSRPVDSRYAALLHPIFLRLMERFDLSYRVADSSSKGHSDPQSLIAQLVPDATPEKDLENVWFTYVVSGDIQQTQICRIVDVKGQSAAAEGLFYQLIVRLHKYSLGREEYIRSLHWQRGLILDDEYNGRALLRHVGNDVHITVRAPYPERFLAMLTEEVKYLVESFWEGLRCDVMVPCLNPNPCIGLFEVRRLIENKRRGRPEQPCPVCNEWENIDQLLRNAPAAQPDATALIFAEFADVKTELAKARQQLTYQGEKIMGRFDRLDGRTRRTLSRVDKTYTDLLQVLTDEAKEGPRLFSLLPVDRGNFNPREWIRAQFRLTLWCEHSRLPLPELNEKDKKKGIYEIELDREWFKKAAPYLKLLTGTLSLVLPIASSAIKLALDDTAFEAIEEDLDLGKNIIDAAIGETTKIGEIYGVTEKTNFEQGEAIHARGATLRELHTLLKAKDPGFGGLVRVMNKRQEFLWVHERFASEY